MASPATASTEPVRLPPDEDASLWQGSPLQWAFHMNQGHRACLECRRKKTKCDMRQPVCGLCYRTGGSCAFPTKRKTPEHRKSPKPSVGKKRKLDPDRLERLVGLLESRLKSGAEPEQLSPPCSEKRGSSSQTNADSPEPSAQPASTTSNSSDLHLSGDESPVDHSTACFDGFRYSGPRETSMDGCERTLEVSEELATELINIFFSKIQAWLPLLHKPRFFARHMNDAGTQFVKQTEYSIVEAFQLHGIFALAARFSTNPLLKEIAPPERGARFAARAGQYYKSLRASEEEPTLSYLQGCIMLNFYLCVTDLGHQAGILTGVCVQLAYDLGLYNMDDEDNDGTHWEGAQEWTDLEERRRAFWLVWELDAFTAIMSRRPNIIDRNRMVVRLPVSDAAWFSQEPAESPVLDPRPSKAWRTLLDSPNQDARAWFLLANYLLAVCSDTYSSRHARTQDQDDLAGSVTCLTLAIQQRFGLDKHPILFDSENYARSNWVIGMHLMLIASRAFASTIGATSSTGTFTSVRELSSVIFHWHPSYVEMSHPFFACCLLPEYTQPFKTQIPLPNGGSQPHQDMLTLLLSGYAAVWKLGSILLDICAIRSDPSEIVKDPRLVKEFAIYFPKTVPCPLRKSSANGSLGKRRMIASANLGLSPDAYWENIGSSTDHLAMAGLPLDFSELQNASMDLLADTNTGVSCFTLDSVLDFNQDLQDELDRPSDDYQAFNYLAL